MALSHAEVIPNHFIRQFVDGAAGNAPPFFENAEPAGDAPGEAQLFASLTVPRGNASVALFLPA